LLPTDTYKNQKGEKIQDTQWHNIVIWGKLAGIAEKYLKKGHEVAVEGKLVHRSL
jgi:single-strand DNA-binding protein